MTNTVVYNSESISPILLQRNEALTRLKAYGTLVMRICLANNTFQAALDSLDPQSRRFVFEAAVREVILLGLIQMMESAQTVSETGLTVL